MTMQELLRIAQTRADGFRRAHAATAELRRLVDVKVDELSAEAAGARIGPYHTAWRAGLIELRMALAQEHDGRIADAARLLADFAQQEIAELKKL